MNYPTYNSSDRNSLLFEAMVEDIAWRERDTVSLLPHREDPYSKRLGQLCLEISDGVATDELMVPAMPKAATFEQRMINRLYCLAVFRQDAEKAGLYQRRLHRTVVDSLQAACEWGGAAWGRVAEYTCLALLTRYSHPWMLAYPSLSHHESDNDIGGHYDVGVILAKPGNAPSSHFLQVKLSCLGQCNRTPKPEEAIVTARQQKYRPNIQLVSGCCELGLHEKTRAGITEVPNLLIKELRNKPTSEELKRLDNLTDNLLLKMTSELLLRGQRSGQSINLTADDFLTLSEYS